MPIIKSMSPRCSGFAIRVNSLLIYNQKRHYTLYNNVRVDLQSARNCNFIHIYNYYFTNHPWRVYQKELEVDKGR